MPLSIEAMIDADFGIWMHPVLEALEKSKFDPAILHDIAESDLMLAHKIANGGYHHALANRHPLSAEDAPSFKQCCAAISREFARRRKAKNQAAPC